VKYAFSEIHFVKYASLLLARYWSYRHCLPVLWRAIPRIGRSSLKNEENIPREIHFVK